MDFHNIKVYTDPDNIPELKNPAVTVGSYDGVHRGHQELLRRVRQAAVDNGGESVVVTFDPHPRQVLEGGNSLCLLTTLDEKALILDRMGIDNLVVIPFTEEFSRLSPHDFVREYLVGKIGIRTLVAGYNHNFGRNREGNYGSLGEYRPEFDYEVIVVPKQEVGEEKVSSTLIRKAIGEGNMSRAAGLLGYNYFIIAETDRYGNLVPGSPVKLLPPPGNYPVEVGAGDKKAPATLTVKGDGSLSLSPGSQFTADDKILITFL